jgi:hypothetical protein
MRFEIWDIRFEIRDVRYQIPDMQSKIIGHARLAKIRAPEGGDPIVAPDDEPRICGAQESGVR